MNHRLKLRYVSRPPAHARSVPAGRLTVSRRGRRAFGHLDLVEIWCPADHGGECNSPEVDGNGRPTGRCWPKENLADYMVLYADNIDLPWMSVQIHGPGPDGHGPVEVRMIAEKG
jgi:hypothetical protein